MSTERLFCSECGTANEADAAFCESCGHRLEAAPAHPAAGASAESAAPAPRSGKGLKLLAIPLALVAVAGGAWALGVPMPEFLSSVGIKTRGATPTADSVQLAPAPQNITLTDQPATGQPIAPVVTPPDASTQTVTRLAPAALPPPPPPPPPQPPTPTRSASRPGATPPPARAAAPPLETGVAPFPSELMAPPPGAAPSSAPATNPASAGAATVTREAPRPGRIAAGSVITLQSSTQICSDKAQQGAKFTALVQQEVSGENGASIPRGTPVVFVVDRLQKASANSKAVFSIAPESVELGGERHSVAATVNSVAIKEKSRSLLGALAGAAATAAATRAAGGDTKQTVAGGVVGGAAGAVIGGQLKTGDGCIEKNAPIRITLTSDITL